MLSVAAQKSGQLVSLHDSATKSMSAVVKEIKRYCGVEWDNMCGLRLRILYCFEIATDALIFNGCDQSKENKI
jgi:hypothetical protein